MAHMDEGSVTKRRGFLKPRGALSRTVKHMEMESVHSFLNRFAFLAALFLLALPISYLAQ